MCSVVLPKNAALPELPELPDGLTALGGLGVVLGAGCGVEASDEIGAAGCRGDAAGSLGARESELAVEVRIAEGESKYLLRAVSTLLLLLRRLRSNLCQVKGVEGVAAPWLSKHRQQRWQRQRRAIGNGMEGS